MWWFTMEKQLIPGVCGMVASLGCSQVEGEWLLAWLTTVEPLDWLEKSWNTCTLHFLHYSIGHNEECLYVAWGVSYPGVVYTIYGTSE